MGVIFLVGMTGAGKTTVGRRLAERLKREFMDLDEEIERSAGRSITKIFEQDGEEVFRTMETRALESISAADVIVALGAGAFEREATLALAHEKGTIVYLRSKVDTLLDRIEPSRETRPLLARHHRREDLRLALEEMLKRRESSYLTAQHVVDVADECGANEIADRIFAELKLT